MNNNSEAEETVKRFALIGAAGYIAPRHLKAISDSGQNLVTAHDVFGSVGILDRYFPDACFTLDEAEFRRSLRELDVDYLSICTPNCFHCAHSEMGMLSGADVICEKPLALNPEELLRIQECSVRTGRKLWTILQLRHHPEIIRLRQMIADGPADKVYDVDLAYITPRGKWYAACWKGDVTKSGGVVTNIGVHFIDMLNWIFGPASEVVVHHSSADCAAGFICLSRARVRFFLSINPNHRPVSGVRTMSAYRHLVIDGNNFDFTDGFTDLHTLSYRNILDGKGFTVSDASPAIDTVWKIRTASPAGLHGDVHPMALGFLK